MSSSSGRAASSGEPLAKVARRDADGNDRDRIHFHNEKMLAKLECPVCMHPMQPPIFTCHSGHSFCNECEPQLHECPICPAYKTKTRNFGMEGMTDDVVYPCRGSGCKESYLLTEKRNHSADCVGRIITCSFSTCNFNGTAAQLMIHTKENNKFHGVVNLELDKFHSARYDLSRFATPFSYTNYVACDGQLFNLRMSKFGDEYGFCVMLCGRQSTAGKYQFEVKFVSPAGVLTLLWALDPYE